MDKNYYTEYYSLERENWWFKVRAAIIIERLEKIIPSSPNLQILNIGAATGRTSELLSRFGEVTSVEYDKACCDFTNEKLGMHIINASITELPFAAASFDVVCAFDVIEHVENDVLAVQEMKRVCKSSGTLAITVPAFQQLWSQHDVVNHHFRRYVMPKLAGLFQPDTDNIVYKTYFNTLLFPLIWIFRRISNWFPVKRTGAGSDFSVIGKKSVFNPVLFQLFNLEKMLLRYFSFPFGVSILICWKKP
ncbi:MAG: class I SAM-dependent methyltransferase [Verrucomicrobia bacterium]|nr:class I SAM-dependent methyltransferase [Cytophagales bacterium]